MKKFFIPFLSVCYLSYGITIDEAVKKALENNLDIKNQVINEKIAEEGIKKSEATRFGKLDIFANYIDYNSRRVVAPLSPPINPQNLKGSRDIFIPGINYTIPLFTGFNIENQIEISKLNQKLENVRTNLTKNEIAFNVRSVYLKILTLKKQLQAMENYKEAVDKLYNDIEQAYKVGKKPEADLLKVQYQKEAVESTIQQIKNNIDTLNKTLQTLLNTQENIEVEDITLKDIDTNLNVDTLLKQYYQDLYSYKVLNLQQKIQESKINIAKSDYFPTISLGTIYQRDIGGSVNREDWQIRVMGNLTIFDFGKRKANLLEEKLSLSKVDIQKQKLLLDKEKQLTDALNQIKTADFKVKATEKQLKYAIEVERVERLKYDEGVSSLYDYLYAQSQRYITEASYYEDIYEKQRAIYYLYYVLEKI